MRRALIVVAGVALPLLGGCYFDTDDQDSVTYHANGVTSVMDRGNSLRFGFGERKHEPLLPEARDLAQATKGRIVMLGGALGPLAGERLARRIDAIRQAGGPPIFVAAVPVAEGDSLERLGWAVRNPTPGSRTLLIDTTTKRVRVVADLPDARKAAVAGAMQAELSAGRLENAIATGIERLAT